MTSAIPKFIIVSLIIISHSIPYSCTIILFEFGRLSLMYASIKTRYMFMNFDERSDRCIRGPDSLPTNSFMEMIENSHREFR